MTHTIRVMVLHSDIPGDAPPDEMDTLIQARWIADLLRKKGYLVTIAPFSKDPLLMQGIISSFSPHCVFNLVETVDGSGKYSYLAAEFCEREGIPYTGSSAQVIILTSNKCATKEALLLKGLPVPRTLWPYKQGGDLAGVGKVIVKPLWEDGSVGLTAKSVFNIGSSGSLIPDGMDHGSCFQGEIFVEEYIEGREFNVSLIGWYGSVVTLPIAEIIFDGYGEGEPRILDYEAKWCPDSLSYKRTIRAFGLEQKDPKLAEELKALSLSCWRVLGLKGYARVDFRVDEAGRPWIIEVNANPCLSPDAGFMAAIREAKIEPEEAIEAILKDALTEVEKRGWTQRSN